MNKRPLVVVLDSFSFFSPSRNGPFEAIADEGYDVLHVNCRNAPGREKSWQAIKNTVSGEGARLAGIVSISGNGHCDTLFDDVRRMGVPLSTWFIDSPHLRKVRAGVNQGEVFIASRDFLHPRLARPKVLLLGAHPPVEDRPEPVKGLGFLGNLHPVELEMLKSAAGIVSATSGRVVVGAELYEAARRPEFLLADWLYPTGEKVDNRQLCHALSTLKRVRHLNQFADLDLEICGPSAWLIDLWLTAPNLLSCFRPALVRNREQMQRHMTQYAVGVNNFHLQIEHGGPNFRTMECAATRVPMLSEFNEGAEEMFPHGVAALYYRGIDEARRYAGELLNSPSLQAELSAAAAGIVLDAHTHRHRALVLLESFGKAPAPSRGRGEVRIVALRGKGALTPTPVPASGDQDDQLPETLFETRRYKDMLGLSRTLLRAERPGAGSRMGAGLRRLGARRRPD